MKVLSATTKSQGDQPGDFTFCVEGEIVFLGFICDTDREDPDHGCGCGRAFAGCTSNTATTTALVIDMDYTATEITDAIADTIERSGWSRDLGEDVALHMLEVAESLKVGTVIGRRLDEVLIRG